MADEVDKIEGKVVQKISFSYTSPFPDALSWSCDDRISVVTDQCVYVITLLFSEDVVKSSLKYHLSCIQAHQECFMFETGDIDNYDLSRTACTKLAVNRLLDPIANPSRTSGMNLTSYRSVAWSPSGCDSYGRCIIATLCLDHRLSLYTTNKTNKEWKEISCISEKWHSKCKTLFDSDPKFKKLKKRKGNPQSKTPVRELIAKSELEMVYINIVALTCLDWCPVLLDHSNQKYALLTAVTKSGKITFWTVDVPCSSDGMADVQLVDSNIQTVIPLPSSVAWYSRDGLEGLLAIGGSNGQIEVLALKVSKDSESNLKIDIPSKHLLWTDCDDLAVNCLQWTYSSKEQCSFATLSASKGSAVVQFSVPLSDGEKLEESKHHIHNEVHSAFVTGLDVCQDGRVFTCDSDGLLQMIDASPNVITHGQYSSSYTCYGIALSPNGLYVALLHSPNITRLQVHKGKNKQVEVSILSIFSEEFLSNVITQSSLSSLWDVQTAICQHYSQNDPPKNGPLLEFLNQSLDSIPFLSLLLRRRLVDQLSKKSEIDSLTSEDGDAESFTGQDWKLESIQTGRQIVKRCLTLSLKSWLQDYKEFEHTEKALTSLMVMSDWLVMQYSDQESLDLAVQVYNTTGNSASAAQAASIREERSKESEKVLTDPLKQERVEKPENAVIDLTQNTEHVSSNGLPPREKCRLCQKDVLLTSLISAECANGHAWKRCLVTFCVCADYSYNRCQDCGGCISLIGQEQSPWLQKRLRETQVCSLCHGWKDSRV
ncbi:general transcription factor 3C polypeptide 4-like [Actinia tenebrosa]|uniref:General transcription factor 3C polypeptide 4-like n=1 Tax=Actinia tenebrosa TaxID=6105 RepID=A0A6P8IQ93_ACTTE|nr:general transcription factor 3C polypeptide 4-like [Actinia tenebrosa]